MIVPSDLPESDIDIPQAAAQKGNVTWPSLRAVFFSSWSQHGQDKTAKKDKNNPSLDFTEYNTPIDERLP